MTYEFAPWVRPIAARFWSTREEVATIARKVPPEAWTTASPVPGWTYHDVLAHLAEGDVSLQHTIRTVAEAGDTDFRQWNNGREDRITGGLERGAGLTAEQLVARVLADGEETQRLLGRLGDEHENLQVITSRTNPEPMSLATHLAKYHHDEEHLEHLRPAIVEGSVAR